MPPANQDNKDEHTILETSSLLLNDNDETSQKKGNEDRNYTGILTTGSLAFAMLVQSYLLVGVFPYSGFLAMHLIPGLNEETAGRYAGWIASSFMIGRTFSSFEWGKAADKYGRTFVIKASLLLSAIFSILFGLAPTFPLALLSRFVLGLCNGLIGPIKTLVSELSHGDQSKETRMMAIVGGMWGYGFLLNPAITGYLSDPVKQYPSSELVALAGSPLTSFPFLLPNICGCLFCLVGFVLVHFFVEETLPMEKRRALRVPSVFPWWCGKSTTTMDSAGIVRRVSSWGLFKHVNLAPADVKSDNDADCNGDGNIQATINNPDIPRWIHPSPSTTALVILSPRSAAKKQINIEEPANTSEQEVQPTEQEEQPATIYSLWQQQSTRQHLLVYWVYSFLVISVDEAFPLFCISKESGLAIEEKMIGNLLSGTGVFYILMQYLLLIMLVDRFGFYKSLRIGALCSIPLVCLIPLSLLTNKGAPPGTLTWPTLIFLSLVYAVVRAFASVTFSTLTMTTNRTVVPAHRATMNGLSMLGGSLAKGAGPAFTGILFSTSVDNITPPYGSALVYSTISLLGLGLFVQSLLLSEHKTLIDKKSVAPSVEDDIDLLIDQGVEEGAGEERPPL